MRESTLVFFVEALGWEHGVEFVFVAFQNRVAYVCHGWDHLAFRRGYPGRRLCLKEAQPYGCGYSLHTEPATSLGSDPKPSTDFPVLERAVKVYIRRCFRCFTCTTCLKKFADKDGFWPGTAKCRKCYKAEREFKCDRCLESLPEASFTAPMLFKRPEQHYKRFCIPCGILGFSPVDLKPYACTRCEKEYGHKKYEEKQLKNWRKRKASSPLECEACLKDYER
jgi:hypothetical protein